MAVRRLRAALNDVGQDVIRPLESLREKENQNKKMILMENFEVSAETGNYNDLKRSDEIKDNISHPIQHVKKEKRAGIQIGISINSIRLKNKSLLLRRKQAEKTPIAIPDSIDQGKSKWRRYLDFFRRKKTQPEKTNFKENKPFSKWRERNYESKKKSNFFQRIGKFVKKKNKVALMQTCPKFFATEDLAINNSNLQQKVEEDETNSLASVSLSTAVCNLDTSVSVEFACNAENNTSVRAAGQTPKKTENEVPKQDVVTKGPDYKKPRFQEHDSSTVNKSSNRTKGNSNELVNKEIRSSDEDKQFWEKVNEMTKVERKLPPLKNVAMDIDISSLRKKTKKPASSVKKTKRNPLDLEMKMIIAEHNRATFIDGRVTPLKLKHEKIVEKNLFKSCEDEAKKHELKLRLAEKEENLKRRKEEERLKELKEHRESMMKMRKKLQYLAERKRQRDAANSQNVANAQKKLPCYFEIPVNMGPQVEKPSEPRPGSVMRNHAAKKNLDEHNLRVMKNRENQMSKKMMKLQNRNERVRSVCEQMKLQPPRYYGDNEQQDNGDKDNDLKDGGRDGENNYSKNQ